MEGLPRRLWLTRPPVVRGPVPWGPARVLVGGPCLLRVGKKASGLDLEALGAFLDFPFTSWMLQANYLPPRSYVHVI